VVSATLPSSNWKATGLCLEVDGNEGALARKLLFIHPHSTDTAFCNLC